MDTPWQVSKKQDSVVISHEVPSVEGWEQWHLLRSDAHWDSPQCDRAMEKRHLEEAVSRNAAIIDCGDMVDAMQGRDDQRRSMAELRKEHAVEAYFSKLQDDHAEHLAPFAKNIAYLGMGNHETAILKHNQINLTAEVARRLRAEHGSPVIAGGYEQFIRFAFQFSGTERASKLMYITHGAGGAAEGTRGTIKVGRRSANIPDADIYVAGHTHHAWAVPIARMHCSRSGKVYEDEALHVQISGYKTRGDFEIQREMFCKPVGAWWLIFSHQNGKLQYNVLRAM